MVYDVLIEPHFRNFNVEVHFSKQRAHLKRMFGYFRFLIGLG